MPNITYAQALNNALREEMRVDPRVFLMGEDIGHHGGIFRVTKDLIDEFGAERVRDTPISESSFVGLGIGAAMAGMRPVVELLFMDFALVAADQIVNQAANFVICLVAQFPYRWWCGHNKAADAAMVRNIHNRLSHGWHKCRDLSSSRLPRLPMRKDCLRAVSARETR